MISTDKKFTFVLTQLVKVPAIKCWYLMLRPEDLALYNDVIMGFGGQIFQDPRAYWNDPHTEKERLQNNNWFAFMYFSIPLSKKWVKTLGDFLKDGVTVLINRKGGMSPFDEHLEVLETREQEDYKPWPDLPDEIITIKQWAGGKHYYLSSNAGRTIQKIKYNTFWDAKQAAKKYVERDDQIVWEAPDYRYRYEGD